MGRRSLSPAIAVTVAGALAACSTYRGTARDVSPAKLASEPGWILVRDVPYVAQELETECGAAALSMVVSYWTGLVPRSIVAHFRPVPERGIAAGRLRDYARERGLAAFVIEGTFEDLKRELAAGRPVLVGLSKPQRKDRVLDHYEVVVGLHRDRRLVVTLDPSEGWRQNTVEGFYREWKLAGFVAIVVSARDLDHDPAPRS
jgi:ABC-type bacteriocin/lantibiotic exporter with double-glycine peptidase domain/predicted small secreted protein